MADKQYPNIQQVNKVYDHYVKPIEAKHKDQYVLVTAKGEIIFAPSLVKVMEKSAKSPSPNNFVFKVGDKVVGKIR